MKRYPIKLTYISKNAIWGGKKLMNEWGKQSADDAIAETWELSVRDKEMATVASGEAKGMTLRDYIAACGADCVSPNYTLDKPFPLLVKFIDAADRLSVQVHPDDIYAHDVESDVGKTEMWYIVDADEGAEIICGLADGASEDDFAVAVKEGRTADVLRRVPVKKGDFFFIPAGQVHAIGAGILIAEIQQNSDLTYRVYDYDRVGADGKKRPLHVEKALDVTRVWSDTDCDAVAFSRGKECVDGQLLANSKYFSVVKKIVSSRLSATVTQKSFCHLLCIDGEGTLSFNDEQLNITRGDSFFLPAGMGDYSIDGNLTVICSEV